jgi:hypothetical protein
VFPPVYKKLYDAGIKQRSRYAILDRSQLLTEVETIKEQFPNCGTEVHIMLIQSNWV